MKAQRATPTFPHVSNDSVAVVHNGIIENYRELKEELIAAGYRFESDTDTEVVAHLIDQRMRETGDLLAAMQQAVARLTGAYSLGVICRDDPERLIAARAGSPLVLGIGIEEHFIASDVFALAPVTQTFVFLEEGDLADVRRESFTLYDREGQVVERPLSYAGQMAGAAGKGGYRHFMLKEIFEQPAVVAETLEGRVHQGRFAGGGFRAPHRRRRSCSSRCKACTSLLAAPAITPVWWPVTGWKIWACPARSKWPASTVTAGG